MTRNRKSERYNSVDYQMEVLAYGLKNGTAKEKRAYNEVAKYIDKQREVNLKENHLFAKLFIYFYGMLLYRNNASVLDKELEKSLHSFLDSPLENFYGFFMDILNDKSFDQIHERNGIKILHHSLKNQEDRLEDCKKSDTFSKEDSKAIKEDLWKWEVVVEELNNMILENLKRFQ
jgi:hypothetical protein